MRIARRFVFLFTALLIPTLAGNLLGQVGGNYWNESSGGFDSKRTSMNYQRSSVFLAGGDYWSTDDTSASKTNYPELFSQTPDYVFDPTASGNHSNHLYPIPATVSAANAADPTLFRVRDGKVQAKMSTFYISGGDFTNGTAGYNAQYDFSQDYAVQSGASNYQKHAPSGAQAMDDLIWLTPAGQLKDYMVVGPAKDQWATDYTTLSTYQNAAQSGTKNFKSGENPYNRAAAALGMLNGSFVNENGDSNLGFGNFYRVADIWINAEDIARTSVQSSSQQDQIVAPGGTYNDAPGSPHPVLSNPQKEQYGYWGPESTKGTDPQQVAWHNSMKQKMTLHPNGDGGGTLLSSIRHGTNTRTSTLTSVELNNLLAELGVVGSLEGPLEILHGLWSSDNRYGHLQDAFYPLWWKMNTETGMFPWTGHGFTYDWYFGYSAADYATMAATSDWATNAFSEFIVRPGADFDVVQTMELVEYLTGVPAVFQPTTVHPPTVPEPQTFLLALFGLALLSRRQRK